MKTISIFLALVNSLLAGFLIVLNLSTGKVHAAALWWLLTKIVAGMFVILVGILTWMGCILPIRPALMALSSLLLVALGAATVVWTFHLAIVSGDMEYYMIVYGGSLFLQGMTSLFGFAGDSRNITIS
jgi:hypothetical protein